jgi:DNA repair exonuclease SbcCD ATPase subunit
MQLGNVWIENFMSILEAHTDFRHRGLTLIQGENNDSDAFESNGAGKSTMFSESVVWALYGQTIRGHKADKVVNRSIGKNTRVGVEITDDNGDLYRIDRYRKHKEHKNHVRLFRNGENITGRSDTETDAMIIDLLQMDFSTFTNSIMFGQGMTKMFASSTDSEQKKILENMLQIDIYKACQEKAKEHLSSIEKQRTAVETDISTLQNQRKTLSDSIELMQTKEAEMEERANKRIAELQLELEGYENESLQSTEDLKEDIKTYEILQKKVDEKITGFKTYEDNEKELSTEANVLLRDMGRLHKEQQDKRERLDDIQNGKNIPKNCETCGQDLPLEDTSHIENHLKEAIEKLGMEWQEKKEEREEVLLLRDKVLEMLKGKEPLEKQWDELQDTIREIRTEIRLVENREKEIRGHIARISKQIKEQEDLLGTTYTGLIEDHYWKLSAIGEELEIKWQEQKELDDLYEKYQFWVNAYGNQGIKSVMLDSVTPFLNKRANHYLNRLADSSIEVKFTTQQKLKSGEMRDKFSVGVINHNGDDDYKGNSGGEKRRIDVAVNMALQDLVLSRSNKRLDLVVYDEVFEGLDAVGSEAVIELLQEKASEVGSILVITHNDSLKQLFTKSLVVEKCDGRTVILEHE